MEKLEKLHDINVKTLEYESIRAELQKINNEVRNKEFILQDIKAEKQNLILERQQLLDKLKEIQHDLSEVERLEMELDSDISAVKTSKVQEKEEKLWKLLGYLNDERVHLNMKKLPTPTEEMEMEMKKATDMRLQELVKSRH